MLRFLIISALVGCAVGSIVQPRTLLTDDRFVGGEHTETKKYPYLVSLRLMGIHVCGATMISDTSVLTAAKCCYYPASLYSVEYGSSKIGTNANVVSVAKVIRHPGYNFKTMDNDFCVVKLSDDIPESVQTIELAREEPKAGAKAVVIGWGTLTESGSSPVTLQQAKLDILDEDKCNFVLEGVITESRFCADLLPGGADACKSYYGGPLVIDHKLVGVVPWGDGCARGVYSYVANQRDWILSQ